MAQWERGYVTLSAVSGPDVYENALLYEVPIGSNLTLRRAILTWDFNLFNTSGSWPDNPAVPVVHGLALTSNTSAGVAPPAPSDGPSTSPALWKVFWDGINWRPNYIAPTGTSIFDATGKIDNSINHLYPPTENVSLWWGMEVLDDAGSGSSYFSNWYAIGYYQLLFDVSGS